MIRRSELGPRCAHCGNINPVAAIELDQNGVVCIHCERSFTFWIEKLPFYCTQDGRPPRCDCDFCTGKAPAFHEDFPPNG